MKKAWIAISAVMLMLAPCVAFAAVQKPTLRANSTLYARADSEFESAIVIDARTGQQLYAYKPDLLWPGASLTKLMNAIVTVNLKPRWSKIVALSSKDEVGGGRLRVVDGSTMSFQDMFYSTLVSSTNNTATAMARLSTLGVAGFVKQMNKNAAAFGMSHTTYVDPSGMDPKNVTTAHDLAILAQKSFGIPTIQQAVDTATYVFSIRNSKVVKKLVSTDELLTHDPNVWVMGGKTGFLYESMYNLIVEMKGYPFTPGQPPVYVVVLGSQTRSGSFASAKSLAEWAWANYEWK
jgi:D-alanyl-D-alanine endopeptidase (penicillin-binding protein 7)